MNDIDRVLVTSEYMAYIKVAEGCNNKCIYPTLPYIGKVVLVEQ